MDALSPPAARARLAEGGLPPEQPLAMPVQSLQAQPETDRRLAPDAGRWARRAFVLLVPLLLTVAAAYEMHAVLDIGGVTGLEWIVLVLFVLLFGWISLTFSTALAGAISLARGRLELGVAPDGPLPDLTLRTAILMPIYNEAPTRVFAGLQAMAESLAETGRADYFDIFILSDTTDPDVWVAEEAAFLDLRAQLPDMRIYYRHRTENTDRKAGNVADWVRRFGGGYEAMLVLDADSVMTGACMVRLAAALERNPGVGLLQTLPVIVGARTLFARLQQFAGRLYGPMLAHGLAFWFGPQGNYWGHNAIIRTEAFAAAAALPHLKGPAPFGGPILSHDFVEAALLVRAGWGVHMLPALTGSYEEGPPSLSTIAVRDRRWCQGNLQHAAVLPARGLSGISRVHLLTGIASYVSAPLWLVMMLAGLLTALQARFVPPDYFPSQFSLFPNWPAQDPARAAWVFIGTMAVLILPKFLALGFALATREVRSGFGGGLRLFIATLSEIIIAGLCAPISMFSQTQAVASILAGRDSGWSAQDRDDGSVPLKAAFRQFLPHMLVGLAFAGATLAIAVPLALWMSPVILGLVLAAPLVAWTSRPLSGSLLTTPEDRACPHVLARAFALRSHFSRYGVPPGAVERLAGDPVLLAFHRAALPEGGRRRAGDHRSERLVARAKLEDAFLGSPLALSRAEMRAALADDVALDRLLAIEAGPPDLSQPRPLPRAPRRPRQAKPA